MKGAGSVFSMLEIAVSASTLRLEAPAGTMSSSSTGTPALASCAAIPAPMTPAPMTAALRIASMTAALRLNPLEDGGDPLAAPYALGCQRIAASCAVQQCCCLADDAGTSRAQRMTQGDRTAIDVEGLVLDAEVTDASE